MIRYENVISPEKPDIILELEDVVLVRENIKNINIYDEIFNNYREAFMYDEIEYTKEEYNNMKLEERVSSLEEEMRLVELAIAEFIGTTINGDTPIALNTIYSEYSAISQMYANMIEKGIYTIEKVPARYRAEVEAVLEANKKED